MKKSIAILFILFVIAGLYAQEISFSFTTNHNCEYAESDSILIENLTQGGDTTLYWNDTVLTFIFTGIDVTNDLHTGFYVSQNYPNPFETKTEIDVFIPEKDDFTINIYDLTGRHVARYQDVFERGMHNFTFYAGSSKTYILTVMSGRYLQHIKMIKFGQEGGLSPEIKYNGSLSAEKTEASFLKQKSIKSYFPYEIGDELRFTVFVSGDFLSVTDSHSESQEYFFDISNTEPVQPSEITGNTTVCENATDLTYSVTQVDGVIYQWTIPGDWTIVSGENTHSITVDTGIEPGEISVKAVNDCGESPARMLDVAVSVPVPTAGSNSPVCEGENLELMVDIGILWLWLGPNGFTSTQQNFSNPNASINLGGTYFVTITDEYGCTGSDQIVIQVLETPDATITPAGPYCDDEPAVTLTAATEGGVWSGEGITDENAGTFEPALVGEGSYVITYEIEADGCIGTDQIIIDVYEIAYATITPVGLQCTGFDPIELEAATEGGIWSGDGITDENAGIFSPLVAGHGEHVITYNVGEGTCADSDEITIIVNATPDATITPVGPFCDDEPAFTLTAATEGGVWSGDGIIDENAGTFESSLAGEGSHVITYEVEVDGCIGADQITIEIYEKSYATITPVGLQCTGFDPIELEAVTTGGIWSGDGITDENAGIFDPVVSGIGEHIITYNVGIDICADSDGITISVNSTPDATITTEAGPYCDDDTEETLSAVTGGGTWSGDGITDENAGVFDPVVAGKGTHIITYEVEVDGCTGTDNITIIVNGIPDTPAEGTHLTGRTKVEWHWNIIPDAEGYKYNTENNYEEAVDIGTNTTYNQEGLECDSMHTLYVWAYNYCGESEVLIISESTDACPPACEGLEGIVYEYEFEYDGHIYEAITIGDQCWMAENLRYLPSVSPPSDGSETEPHYYVYNYFSYNVEDAKATANYNTYGVLYNWVAAMQGASSSSSNPSGVQGVCPPEWHLPSDAEWKELETVIGIGESEINETGSRGTNQGSQLATSASLWQSGVLKEDPEFGAIGFKGLPTGGRYYTGIFSNLGRNALWWSSTLLQGSTTHAWNREIDYQNTGLGRNYVYRETGRAVRCIWSHIPVP